MEKRRFFEVEVIENIELSPNIFGLAFKTEQPLKALPGQFISLQSLCLEKPCGRPFTIHQQDTNNFSIVFEKKGENTEKYSWLENGDKIKIIGPLGKPLVIDFTNDHNIFVAGGIGISGLAFAIYDLCKEFGRPVSLYIGARNQDFFKPFDYSKLGRNLTVRTITNEKGVVTDLLEKDLKKRPEFFAGANIIACGPLPMLKKTAEIAAQFKIPCQVVMETLVACGVGSCKGCWIPKIGGGHFHLCRDGPALPAEQVDFKKLERPGVIVAEEKSTPVEE